MVKIYHRKNEVAIDLTGVDTPMAIDIEYSGRMYAESQMPENWISLCGKTKIMCIKLSNNNNIIPELLFNYSGLINIRGGAVIDNYLKKHNLKVIVEDIDYWENATVDFDKNTQYWEGLNSFHSKNKKIIKSSIVRNDLIANDEELFFGDGASYNGQYHMYGNGLVMSGATHTVESEILFRKDLNGNLVSPKDKRLKYKTKKIIQEYVPYIPSVRVISKSSTNIANNLRKEQAEKNGEVFNILDDTKLKKSVDNLKRFSKILKDKSY